MAHNGGRTQLGLNFLYAGEHAFCNRMHEAANWVGANSSKQLLGQDRDVNGYPTRLDNLRNSSDVAGTDGGVKNQYARGETLAEYDGLWVHSWFGKGTVGLTGSSYGPGYSAADRTTATETNGYYEIFGNTNGFFEPQITDIPTLGQHPRDMLICRKDHYAYYLEQRALKPTLEPYSPNFLAALTDLNPGYLRFLDWGQFNTHTGALWDHRMKTGFYNFQGLDLRAEYLAPGNTTNVSDDYSVAFPGFGSLSHGKAVIVRWNASATGTTVTLDVEGTGAKQLRHPTGSALFTTNRPIAFAYALCVYDADLDCWIKIGGDAVSSHQGMPPMVPFEDCFNLCNIIGAHAWFPSPRMALDAGTLTGTDWIQELCELADEMLDPGLKIIFESINEPFNGASGFHGRAYARLKAQAHWPAGGEFNEKNWIGKTCAILGKTVKDYFADKGGTDRYETLIGVQHVFGGAPITTSWDPQQTAADWVANDGGWAAHRDCTGVTWANYWGAAKTTNQLLASGYDLEFQTADAARQLEILDWFLGTTDPAPQAIEMELWETNWTDWANKFVPMRTLKYEGGPSFDALPSTPTLTISGASKAAQCVITVTATDLAGVGLIGRPVAFASVGGMVELNGNSYVIVAQSASSITIDVDSTGFTTYTSGGTVTMTGTQFTVNNIRLLAYRAPRCFSIMQQIHQRLLAIPNAICPSQFLLIGGAITITPPSTASGQAWGIGHGNIHVPDWSPGYDAIKLCNTRKIRLGLGTPSEG